MTDVNKVVLACTRSRGQGDGSAGEGREPGHREGDPRHLLFIIECKKPEETSGISQLEAYFVGEPHVQLGIWANDADPSALSVYIYRRSDGRLLLKRGCINELPKPGEAIRPETRRTCYEDLIQPTERRFRSTIEDSLGKVVSLPECRQGSMAESRPDADESRGLRLQVS